MHFKYDAQGTADGRQGMIMFYAYIFSM